MDRNISSAARLCPGGRNCADYRSLTRDSGARVARAGKVVGTSNQDKKLYSVNVHCLKDFITVFVDSLFFMCFFFNLLTNEKVYISLPSG